MITYVSKEKNLGPDDKIRYIWGLKIICQENCESVNFCCSDKRFKENHIVENRDKNSCPFKSYVNLFYAEALYCTYFLKDFQK